MPGRGLWAAGAFGVRAITQAAALELRAGDPRRAADHRRRDPPRRRHTRPGVDPETLADPDEIAQAVRFLAKQGTRAATHELQVTPLGETLGAVAAIVNDSGKRVAWVELYLDLIFVLAVGQLAHVIEAEPEMHSVWIALGLFVTLWWTWIGFAVPRRAHSLRAEHGAHARRARRGQHARPAGGARLRESRPCCSRSRSGFPSHGGSSCRGSRSAASRGGTARGP